MKTSKEMADSVFRLRDEYFEAKRKRNIKIKKVSSVCASVCAFALIVFGADRIYEKKMILPADNNFVAGTSCVSEESDSDAASTTAIAEMELEAPLTTAPVTTAVQTKPPEKRETTTVTTTVTATETVKQTEAAPIVTTASSAKTEVQTETTTQTTAQTTETTAETNPQKVPVKIDTISSVEYVYTSPDEKISYKKKLEYSRSDDGNMMLTDVFSAENIETGELNITAKFSGSGSSQSEIDEKYVLAFLLSQYSERNIIAVCTESENEHYILKAQLNN